MHQICRYELYVATTFRLSVYHSYFNGAERRARNLRTRYGAKKPGAGLRYSDVMHAFPYSAISESNCSPSDGIIFFHANCYMLIMSKCRGDCDPDGCTLWVIAKREPLCSGDFRKKRPCIHSTPPPYGWQKTLHT